MTNFEVNPQGIDPTSTSRFTAINDAVKAAPVVHGLDPEDVATINALPPTSALLIAHTGANAGARFLLNADSTTVGRHPKSDIFLDDFTVSRKHRFLPPRRARFLRARYRITQRYLRQSPTSRGG